MIQKSSSKFQDSGQAKILDRILILWKITDREFSDCWKARPGPWCRFFSRADLTATWLEPDSSPRVEFQSRFLILQKGFKCLSLPFIFVSLRFFFFKGLYRLGNVVKENNSHDPFWTPLLCFHFFTFKPSRLGMHVSRIGVLVVWSVGWWWWWCLDKKLRDRANPYTPDGTSACRWEPRIKRSLLHQPQWKIAERLPHVQLARHFLSRHHQRASTSNDEKERRK